LYSWTGKTSRIRIGDLGVSINRSGRDVTLVVDKNEWI
jgi:hypothetical protein